MLLLSRQPPGHFSKGSANTANKDQARMMPTPQTPPSPSSQPPPQDPHPIVLQPSYPYFTSKQITALTTRLTTPVLPEPKQVQIRLQACWWIEEVATHLQCPVRTIGTAMMLYLRFHLFNRMSDFQFTDVAAACLFVACKQEDTLKKLREILLAGYTTRHPNGPEINPESQTLEEQRRKIIIYERHVLETASFDFRSRHPQPYIIKFTRYLKLPKEIANQAWKISLDGYRTFAPLKHPPHILALAYIHLSSLLSSHPITIPYRTFKACQTDVDLVMIDLLDLYIHHLAVTHVGPEFPLSKFMNLQIQIRRGLRGEEEGDAEVPAMRDASAGDRGTVRFILDWERVVRESEILDSLER